MSDTDPNRERLKQRLLNSRLRSVLIELVDTLNSHQVAIGCLMIDDRAGAATAMASAGNAIAAATDQIGTIIEAGD